MLTPLNQVGYAFILILIVVPGTLKVSILSLYLRMTPTPLHKRIYCIVMGFVIAHDIAALFGSIFSCVPVSQYRDYSSYTIFKDPACIDYLPFEIFNSAWSALEDIVIWMLPVPIVWGLKVCAKENGLVLPSWGQSRLRHLRHSPTCCDDFLDPLGGHIVELSSYSFPLQHRGLCCYYHLLNSCHTAFV